MGETAVPFAPLRYTEGHLPLEDYGLVGDCSTAALVGRDGGVCWMCAPRFDSEAIFCSLLDPVRGGHFAIAPVGVLEARQSYLEDTAVLQTEMRSATALVRVTDACTLHAGADLREDVSHARGELLRVVEVLDGTTELEVELAPRGGASVEPAIGALRVHCHRFPGLQLRLTASHPLDSLRCRLPVRAGDRLWYVLRWGEAMSTQSWDPGAILEQTVLAWRRWIRSFAYEGPQHALVRRSAFVLKLLDYSANGAMVAAPTSSLPERIGGARNWDYRYTWIRDAAFSVYALRRIGLTREGESFVQWVLNTIEHGARPRVLYDLDGRQPRRETEDRELAGYRCSWPVRWGNAAAEQRQHDVYGEMLDCAYQWVAHGGAIDATLWNRLHDLVCRAGTQWREPDHGIWEVRTASRPFTYSAALCQVALDRGARLAQRFGLEGDHASWIETAGEIREAILREAWDEKRQALTEHLGGGGLDASLLCLPLRRVIPARHPQMIATAAAIERELSAGGGLLYRYRHEESPDGLPGDEGAFLLCSFWLVDNYAKQGRLDRAHALFDSLCARAGPLGLLPEQVDPASGAFLGNFPQAFSHVGVISSGINLMRCTHEASRK